MRSLHAVLAAGVLILAVLPSHAQAPRIYTPTHGTSCVDRSRAQFQAWRCPGPHGYVAEYFDDGNMAGVAIWNPARSRAAQVSIPWRGAGRVFDNLLEWHLRDGGPSAAILRIWRIATTAEGHERELEELMVLKLQPVGTCRIGSVSARQADANLRAQEIASLALSMPCLGAEDS
jgi:hypothetical protein